MAKKSKRGDMAEDYAAIAAAMEADRTKNPPLGSPAWIRKNQETRTEEK